MEPSAFQFEGIMDEVDKTGARAIIFLLWPNGEVVGIRRGITPEDAGKFLGVPYDEVCGEMKARFVVER